ncbi:P-loop containing nucleoside triphosphate hydrolase protein [Phlegmacium glaucopus]|nr:P-loop containing nucleoside triphosphate hydrolase protein [Phlegmacium glaucopus]
MSRPILQLSNIKCSRDQGINLFSDVNIDINEGDIVVLQGRSGSGKSTLLKCIAHLVLHDGETLYRGRFVLLSSTPRGLKVVDKSLCRSALLRRSASIPSYRTRVMYVPQRPSLLPGSPADFVKAVMNLHSQRNLTKNDVEETTQQVMQRCLETSRAWGIDSDLWDRDWLNLSGGEGQRMLLSIAASLNGAEILLLDEPTSALDLETSLMVEKFLVDMVRTHKSSLKAIVWITHSQEQSRRVGNRSVYLSAGGCHEGDDEAAPSPYLISPIPVG